MLFNTGPIFPPKSIIALEDSWRNYVYCHLWKSMSKRLQKARINYRITDDGRAAVEQYRNSQLQSIMGSIEDLF
jgi:hypothetical protein